MKKVDSNMLKFNKISTKNSNQRVPTEEITTMSSSVEELVSRNIIFPSNIAFDIILGLFGSDNISSGTAIDYFEENLIKSFNYTDIKEAFKFGENDEYVKVILDNDNSSLIDNTQPIIIGVEDTAVSSEKELTEEEIRAMEEEVVKLVNEERAKYGLQPLQISEKLMQTAREKSKDMATNNYFSHTDPNGYNMARDLNVAENVHGGSSDPKGAIYSWLNSKGHRENILNPNDKYIGVGFAKNNNSEYSNYWTQQFGSNDKWAN